MSMLTLAALIAMSDPATVYSDDDSGCEGERATRPFWGSAISNVLSDEDEGRERSESAVLGSEDEEDTAEEEDYEGGESSSDESSESEDAVLQLNAIASELHSVKAELKAPDVANDDSNTFALTTADECITEIHRSITFLRTTVTLLVADVNSLVSYSSKQKRKIAKLKASNDELAERLDESEGGREREASDAKELRQKVKLLKREVKQQQQQKQRQQHRVDGLEYEGDETLLLDFDSCYLSNYNDDDTVSQMSSDTALTAAVTPVPVLHVTYMAKVLGLSFARREALFDLREGHTGECVYVYAIDPTTHSGDLGVRVNMTVVEINGVGVEAWGVIRVRQELMSGVRPLTIGFR
jgi:hypothetical protein